jgi:cytochrome c oxidase assembly factor CtaG
MRAQLRRSPCWSRYPRWMERFLARIPRWAWWTLVLGTVVVIWASALLSNSQLGGLVVAIPAAVAGIWLATVPVLRWRDQQDDRKAFKREVDDIDEELRKLIEGKL